jgi:signal transduction histidine kinase/CHASE3 domain sensor protein/ActR/RegA family two-component response regulator
MGELNVLNEQGPRHVASQPILLALGFVILVVISAASIWLVFRSQSDNLLVVHTVDVQNKLARIEVMLRGAEDQQLGYLLTGQPEYLDLFDGFVEGVKSEYSALKLELADNPQLLEELAAIEPLMDEAFDRLNQTIQEYKSGDSIDALRMVRSGVGPGLIEKIHTAIERITSEEQRLLQIRSSDSKRTNFGLLAITLFGTALIIGLAMVSVATVRRSNREREAALLSLQATNAGLEAAVSERTSHLDQAYGEIQRTVTVLHNTIASMADAVLVVDEGPRIVISNPAAERLFGSSAEVGSAVPAEDSHATYKCLSAEGTPLSKDEIPVVRAARGESVDNVEIIVRRPVSPKVVHLVANGRPLRDATGAVIGAVMVYHDVTQAVEIERQLRQSQKMDAIGQLTGGVAHDFNNILTVITGTIDILANAVRHDPTLAAIAKMIDEAAERAAELTRRLLAFSRRQPLQPRATDINALIVDSARLLRPAVGEPIEVALELEPEAWPALVDPNQLTTALLNLAFNARDAMPNGGKLTLETSNVVLDGDYARVHDGVAPGHYTLIVVSDTGSGIPEAIRDKVFEPFFTTKEVGRGTGLGLSMVYGFVKQSGGHISLSSERGLGTSINIYLPRACEQTEGPSEILPVAPLQGGAESILVTEDDAMVRTHVVAQLTSLGYKTLSAANAAQALGILDQGEHIDLLFTDVVMPGEMNGRDLADEVLRRRPTARVLFTSGYTEKVLTHNGQLDPGLQLLAKPYRKADLARMIRVALSAPTTVSEKVA